MTPEYYMDALTAASAHRADALLDLITAARQGMSPMGFKRPDKLMRERHKQIKSLENRRMILLKATDTLLDSEAKIQRDRDRLKAGVQEQIRLHKEKMKANV